jgi:ethanolamine ammonia-lyase small subunit
MSDHDPVTASLPATAQPGSAHDPWRDLARFTQARIALGRAGGSLPTGPLLAFQLSHAQARDAVLQALDMEKLAGALQGIAPGILRLQSGAADRQTYIARPDLGRVLGDASTGQLAACAAPDVQYDVAFVVADGLSALAVERHAAPLLRLLLPRLAAEGWSIAPLSLVAQGRVAVADDIGQALGAKLSVILIGERPGLSSPDSLGAYLTWAPQRGRGNAERNCVSNIREPDGLSYASAAAKLHYLMTESRRLRLSGVDLKEDAPLPAPPAATALPDQD